MSFTKRFLLLLTRFGCLGLTARLLASPPQPSADALTSFVISVPDQRLAVIQAGRLTATFPISTSKFGLGSDFGSYKTPLGLFRVAEKIGAELPQGSVIKKGNATGEVIAIDAPGRDAIVTRLFCLEGTEETNANSYSRGICIHGTPEEARIGQPVSWGCVRMRSCDVIRVFDFATRGSSVQIIDEPLSSACASELPSTQFLLVGRPPAPPTDPAAIWLPMRFQLAPHRSQIPVGFSDIGWSAAIAGWSYGGQTAIWQPLSNRPAPASRKVVSRTNQRTRTPH